VPVGDNLVVAAVSCGGRPQVGKRGVAMHEQTKKAMIIAKSPPFLFANVDVANKTTDDPNVMVTVEGLGGVGRLRQAFLQLLQDPDLKPETPDRFTLHLIEIGRDYIVFHIRRVDTNKSGWHQNLKIQMLLIAS
jgi:hypothetical protein